ncbi:putative bifunctional diguanylate cyclase/phosphodiesterase [Demequina flava]|uniref:putative bifunctional diguanylate cyclase/phosphodiesterase n=1 Tax=Demequina flava TaxID=1095025 RepID=UPI0007804ABC|nr:EAL domain-containing protein [Demequina flava]
MAGDELFRTAFDGAAVGMAVLDEDGRIEQSNGALTSMVGESAGALNGRSLRDVTHPDDTSRDARVWDRLSRGISEHIHSQRRLLHNDGDVVWVRATFSRVPGDPMRVIMQVEDVSEARHTQALLEHRAHHDHLTGLPNRALLLDQLSTLLDTPEPRVACLFLDLDHFTVVNDSQGHDVGDRLLEEVARRIQAATRGHDTIARLGGDEFVIVAPGIGTLAEASTLAESISEGLRWPMIVGGHEIAPSASIGIALAAPDSTPQSLVRDADVAMSHAKRSGRNQAQAFSENMRHHAQMRLSVETELRVALREGQLEVHFQPIVELATAEVRAYEALVRWRHPHRGLLMPDDFLDICEEANLVVPMGEVVLRDACAFIARRPDFDGRVLVNISTQQIGGNGLVDAVADALNESGIRPGQLALEITESGMLLATHATRTELEQLAAMGIDLLLDDFGTGYSALSSVLRSPVTGMKLAREFTLRLGDDATGDRISTAISSLVASLGMVGIIEGVETEAQRRVAISHGWTLAQGFLFDHARPDHQIPLAPGVIAVPGDVHDSPAEASSPVR